MTFLFKKLIVGDMAMTRHAKLHIRNLWSLNRKKCSSVSLSQNLKTYLSPQKVTNFRAFLVLVEKNCTADVKMQAPNNFRLAGSRLFPNTLYHWNENIWEELELNLGPLVPKAVALTIRPWVHVPVLQRWSK